MRETRLQTFGQLHDGLRLIARRLVVGHEFEGSSFHGCSANIAGFPALFPTERNVVPFPVSRRAQRVKPSSTLAVTALVARLKAEGRDVIGLGAGEPDFDTPAHIGAAGVQAINSGFTRYTNVDGIPELKDAIIAKFRRDNGIPYQRDQILVSSGAKQCIFNLCMALLDSADEGIVPGPYGGSCPDMALRPGGRPAAPRRGPGQRYKMTPAALPAAT